MTHAARLAIAEANEVCNAVGVHLEANILDDAGNPQEGCRVAHCFADDDAVLPIIGHYNSNVTLATAPLYMEGRLPLVAPIVSNPETDRIRMDQRLPFYQPGRHHHSRDRPLPARRTAKVVRNVVETETVYGSRMSAQFIAAWRSGCQAGASN
jgi:branched-chain amino acid transport system substrate-binding protein